MVRDCFPEGDWVSPARVLVESLVLYHDVFHSDIKAKSIYFRDTESGQHQPVKGGLSGWALHAVVSCASFRRILRDLKSCSPWWCFTSTTILQRSMALGKNLWHTVRMLVLQGQVDTARITAMVLPIRQRSWTHKNFRVFSNACVWFWECMTNPAHLEPSQSLSPSWASRNGSGLGSTSSTRMHDLLIA